VRAACACVRWCVFIVVRVWVSGILVLFACFLLFYVFGARLGFVLGGVCVLCLLVCGDVF
jgi:hypothetical protein